MNDFYLRMDVSCEEMVSHLTVYLYTYKQHYTCCALYHYYSSLNERDDLNFTELFHMQYLVEHLN